MKSFLSFAFLIITMSSTVLAAGQADGGHGNPKDLIAPAVNLFILFSLLIWKLKKPLSEHFTSKAETVSNTLERASLKSQEAQMMLEMEERKKKNLESEMKRILAQVDSDVANYEKALTREVEEKIHKLKIDANSKILTDKKDMVDKLNQELLDQVLSKTKHTIKTNKDYQNKVSGKLLQGL
jgi:F0F1-type ATP synthase membrane subunit b/b'